MPKPAHGNGMIPIVLDMETGDPDDVFTLLLAVSHPRVSLVAVTITPGSQDQVTLVKYIMETVLGMAESRRVCVGAQEWPKHQNKRNCVDLQKWAKILHPVDLQQQTPDTGKGKPRKGKKDGNQRTSLINPSGNISEWGIRPAAELILEICRDHPEATVLTCGPTHNLGAAIALGAKIHRWVAQGGFCGSNLVQDRSSILPKFQGKTNVASWNFGGSREATLSALQADKDIIERRVLVGKNVCHACTYDDYFSSRLQEFLQREDETSKGGRKKGKIAGGGCHLRALQWLDAILTAKYQKEGIISNQKALHDLLALATSIDESVCVLAEVLVNVTEDNKWGAVEAAAGSTRTFAAISFDKETFVDVLLVN